MLACACSGAGPVLHMDKGAYPRGLNAGKHTPKGNQHSESQVEADSAFVKRTFALWTILEKLARDQDRRQLLLLPSFCRVQGACCHLLAGTAAVPV